MRTSCKEKAKSYFSGERSVRRTIFKQRLAHSQDVRRQRVGRLRKKDV